MLYNVITFINNVSGRGVKISESKAQGNGRQKTRDNSHNQNGAGCRAMQIAHTTGEVWNLAGNKNSGIGSGGKRVGAGRKSKPLADKILEGNPGKRALKRIEFENGSVDVPEVNPAEFTASSIP